MGEGELEPRVHQEGRRLGISVVPSVPSVASVASVAPHQRMVLYQRMNHELFRPHLRTGQRAITENSSASDQTGRFSRALFEFLLRGSSRENAVRT